jgi:hypothetical protein
MRIDGESAIVIAVSQIFKLVARTLCASLSSIACEAIQKRIDEVELHSVYSE